MMGSLGYVWHTPDEEKNHMTQAEMEAHIVICMGGRVAESLKFPSVTAGAVQDIEDATKYARTMVTMYGMSDKLGMVQYEAVTGEYLDKRRVLQCSDETATKIDEEVRVIISRAYKKAYDLLSQHLDLMDKLADYLVEHETISGEQFMTIYNEITGSDLPVKRQLDSKGFAIDTEELYNIGIVNPSDSDDSFKSSISSAAGTSDRTAKLKKQKKEKNKDKDKEKDKDKDKSDKKDKAAKKAKKEKTKFKVYASSEFKAKRDALLNEEDDIEDISDSENKSFDSDNSSSNSGNSSSASENSSPDEENEELVITSLSSSKAPERNSDQERQVLPWENVADEDEEYTEVVADVDETVDAEDADDVVDADDAVDVDDTDNADDADDSAE